MKQLGMGWGVQCRTGRLGVEWRFLKLYDRLSSSFETAHPLIAGSNKAQNEMRNKMWKAV